MTHPAFGDPGSGASSFDDARLNGLCLNSLLSIEAEKVYFKDLGSRFVRASQVHIQLFGVDSVQDVVGKTDFDFFTSEHAIPTYEVEQEVMRSGRPLVGLEEMETWADRAPTWVVTTLEPLRDERGAVVGLCGISHDITERKQLASELAQVEHELRNLLETSPDPMVRFDGQLRFVYANPAAAELFDCPAGRLVGRSNRELGHRDEFLGQWEPALRRVLDSGESGELEMEVHLGDVPPRYLQSRLVAELDPDGAVAGVFVIMRDLTDRRRAENALAAQAVRDPLTGLANRVLVADRIQQALVRLEREPGRVAVLFLDLDRFKVVNDSLGHEAGDAVLVEVAQRLLRAARRSDTVARFGGDEFVVLCDRVSAGEDAAVVAGRIARALGEPFTFHDQPIHITGSIGIAVAEDPATTPAELLRDADAAMYEAKQRGHHSGSFRFFDTTVRERAVARMSMDEQLRAALTNREFTLVYQPLVTLTDERRLQGFEALIRWNHPDRGLLDPDAFINVAEDTNLIIPIGRWVLHEACRQLALWNSGRPADQALTMAVNISARQLGHVQLAADVATVLHHHRIPPHLLTLELTETALLEQAVIAGAVLNNLSALGVQLALDDFGTGYSSLGHLRRYPVNILKIDRSFVDGLGEGHGHSAIVAAVTAMAHALGMTTVGEGIETTGQFDALKALGCDDGQGYLMARPMTPEQLRLELGVNEGRVGEG